jgi:kinetochore-associated protein 1
MDSNGKFFILCTNGSIYEMMSIEDHELATNISADFDATVMDQTALFSPALERIRSTRISNKIYAFCFVPSVWGNSFIISCADYMVLIDDCHASKIKYLEGNSAIVKILNLENFIFGLTENGSLIEICAFTQTMRKIEMPEDLVIDDIRIIESNEEFIELLIISKPSNDRSMKVVDFPSFKTKSEISLPAQSWIVSQAKSGVNMYFIEGYRNENNFVQTIEIKSITDTDPEQRFTKLLMRGQFEEAEDFANTCGLSLEPLHKMKVRKTLAELSASRNIEIIDEKFALLMEQVLKIEDKSFLVSLRNSAIPDRSSLTKFLEHILKSINTNDFPNETNEINELLLRLETLRLIDPDDTNMRWQKFLEEKDMQKAATEYFKTDVLLSCLVWSRHASSIIPNMNLQNFYAWLSRIPNKIEPFHIIQWLKHFSPCFLQAYPEETTKMIDWCLERTRELQFSPAWPEIGLEFINNINVIFKDMKFMFVDIRRSYHSNIEKIQKLINTLEEMVVLKQTYHLIISLDDYSRNSIEETAFRLMQRIQIHNLAKMVNDFIYPIFMERGLVPEETIVRYINFLANNKNLGFWQERAVVAIDLLNNEENRLNCALLILKVSPVPWSDVVMPLAKIGTVSSHPIANSILIEYKSQAIKMIKMKYGWPVDYFDFQQDRIQLVFRILKMNYPEMIQDIKTLIETSPDITNDAYLHLNCRLVELGKIDELCEVINDLNNENEQQQIILKCIEVFIAYLDGDMVEEENVQHYMEALKFLITRLKDYIDDFKFLFQKQRIEKIKNVINLRNELRMRIK